MATIKMSWEMILRLYGGNSALEMGKFFWWIFFNRIYVAMSSMYVARSSNSHLRERKISNDKKKQWPDEEKTLSRLNFSLLFIPIEAASYNLWHSIFPLHVNASSFFSKKKNTTSWKSYTWKQEEAKSYKLQLWMCWGGCNDFSFFISTFLPCYF